MGLLKALNIEKGEGGSVGLMMAQSFFLGAFIITFQISSNSLFLKEVGAESLTAGYMYSGAIGITLTLIYSFLQKRMSFSLLANIIYALVAASTLLVWAGFGSGVMTDKEIVYICFLINGPLIVVVAYVTFWGVMGRIFSLRQGKRLFGLIDSGQILAMILVSFSIPFIVKALSGTKDLILVGGVSLSIAFLLQILVTIRFRKELGGGSKKNETAEEKEAKKDAQVSKYLKNPYIRMLAIFVFLSMLTQFFVEYSFMNSVNNNYPEERDLTNFFGYFMGTLLIFSFVFKVFISGKLIQMYGLKVNLLILPIVLVFFTIIASIMGTIGNYEGEPGKFVFFFMFIISSKLFAQSLRVSIEVPAFKIMYQPLDKGIRYDVQARIDGFINELSAFLGGVILYVFGLVGFKLIHYSWMLIPIIAVWAFLTIKLYDKYQQTLRDSLSNIQSGIGKIVKKVASGGISALLKQEVKEPKADLAINAIKISNNISPVLYLNTLQESLLSSASEVRDFGSTQLKNSNEFSSINEIRERINTESDGNIKENLAKLVEEVAEYSDSIISELELYKMSRSKLREERIKLAKILTLEAYSDHTNIIADLLKDLDSGVRKEAIMAVVKLKKEDLYLPMIDNLAKEEYNSITTHAILTLGEDILEELETAFYKAGFASRELSRVVDLIGEINGPKSQEYLVAKLTIPDIQVVDAVLVALHKCGYQADEGQKGKIIQAIDTNIGVAMWNYASLIEIRKYKFGQELEEAMLFELETNFNHLFLLLGLLYDPKSIKHIKENIESGTAEGIGFAIELLDIFVDEQLKQKLFPILDDLSIEDRVKTLQPFYPRFELEEEEALKSVLNRSFTELNRWTKTCALVAFGDIKNVKVCDDLIAHLFNPDYVIREAAASVLRKIDEQSFGRLLNRIDEDLRFFLRERLFEIREGKELSLYDKVLLLKSVPQFNKSKGKDLVDLVEKMDLELFLRDDEINGEEEDNHDENYLRVVWKGKAVLKDAEKILMSFNQGNAFSNYLKLESDSNEAKFVALEDTAVFTIRDKDLFRILIENDKLANSIMSVFRSRLVQPEEKETLENA